MPQALNACHDTNLHEWVSDPHKRAITTEDSSSLHPCDDRQDSWGGNQGGRTSVVARFHAVELLEQSCDESFQRVGKSLDHY